MHAVVTHDHLRGDTEFGRLDGKAGRSRVWDPDLLPGRHGHGLGSRSPRRRPGRWNWPAAVHTCPWWSGVGDATKPAPGADVCSAYARCAGHGRVRRLGEGSEWRDATGHLYADTHHYIQRADTNAAQLLNTRCQIDGGVDLAMRGRHPDPNPDGRNTDSCRVRYSNIRASVQASLYIPNPN
jgi:hypothetical protein